MYNNEVSRGTLHTEQYRNEVAETVQKDVNGEQFKRQIDSVNRYFPPKAQALGYLLSNTNDVLAQSIIIDRLTKLLAQHKRDLSQILNEFE